MRHALPLLLLGLLFLIAEDRAALAGQVTSQAFRASSSGATPSAFSVPPPPPVSDPMLAPVPPPARILHSWNEAVGYLRARSTDLKIALDQVLEAEAQTRIALSNYLPTITANGVLTHQLITATLPKAATAAACGGSGGSNCPTSTIPIQNVESGSVQLQQAIINAPLFDQISIQELGEDAARLSVEDTRRTLVLSLANQIVSVVTAEREAEINRVGLRVALEQLEIATRKQSLGAANGLDVVRAAQNAANARATLVAGDESLREARESLGLALGIPEETGVAPDVDVSALAGSATQSCREVKSVDARADVAAAAVRLDVARRNLRNVWLTFAPTLSGQSTISATSTAQSPYPNPTWNIQGVLSWTVWDGGQRYGNLRNDRAAIDLAAQQLEALRRQAIIQVEQAQRQLVVAGETDRVAREQRDLAAQNDEMTQAAYTVGQGTSLELVTASEAHRQAEINLALQDFNVVKARILALLALATCPW